MSLINIQKQLHQLTYSEMLILAGELRQKLAIGPDTSTVATTLLALDLPGAAEHAKTDDSYLRDIFNRKRQLSINRHEKGWEVAIHTVPGSVAVNQDLRTAINFSLDQCVAMRAMGMFK